TDDLGQDLLQPPHQLERTLGRVLLLERMQVPEAGKIDYALVHARVVLHRARAERVEARVDTEGSVREGSEVPDKLRLRDLGQPGRTGAAKLLRHLRGRKLRPW